MAFPTTSVLNSFTQANGAPSNAVAGFGDTLPPVVSNRVQSNAGGWFGLVHAPSGTPASFSAPQEAYYTIPLADNASSQPAGVVARGTNLNTGTYTGYVVYVSGGFIRIGKFAPSFSLLIADDAITVAAGDAIGIEVITVGSDVRINGYYKLAAGAWPGTPTITYLDTASPITSGGQIAIAFHATGSGTNGADDFGGGTTSAGTDATVDLDTPNVVADATGDLPTPTVSTPDATVLAPVMAALGDFPDTGMVVSVDVVLTAPMAATGDMPDPTVTGSGNATVTAPVADATGDLLAPAVTADSATTSPAADATGDLTAPAVTAASTVTAPVADAAGDLVTPVQVGAPQERIRLGNVTTGATEVPSRATRGTGGNEPAHFTGGTEVLSVTGAAEVVLV